MFVSIHEIEKNPRTLFITTPPTQPPIHLENISPQNFEKGIFTCVFLKPQFLFTNGFYKSKTFKWTPSGVRSYLPFGDKRFSRFQKGRITIRISKASKQVARQQLKNKGSLSILPPPTIFFTFCSHPNFRPIFQFRPEKGHSSPVTPNPSPPPIFG